MDASMQVILIGLSRHKIPMPARDLRCSMDLTRRPSVLKMARENGWAESIGAKGMREWFITPAGRAELNKLMPNYTQSTIEETDAPLVTP